ncbi:hypothetical protein R1flu_027024 [Riccia fluitans]|uniref:Squalene cyclase N-terminal domain-containing protein n=1 Tax=Riccia fluitans TaxID=41844 RepID=A0ABD1XHN2_9MARC
MTCQMLGLNISESKAEKIVKYYRKTQNPADGSWSIAHGVEGDISTTCEAYVALAILGVEAEDDALHSKMFHSQKRGASRHSNLHPNKPGAVRSFSLGRSPCSTSRADSAAA